LLENIKIEVGRFARKVGRFARKVGRFARKVGRFKILTVTVSATSTTLHSLHFYVFVEGLVVS